jgi:hypothetical protein
MRQGLKKHGYTHQSIYDMPRVRIVSFIGSLAANEIHYFMFSFTGDTGVRNVHLELCIAISTSPSIINRTHILPTGVGIQLLDHPVPK